MLNAPHPGLGRGPGSGPSRAPTRPGLEVGSGGAGPGPGPGRLRLENQAPQFHAPTRCREGAGSRPGPGARVMLKYGSKSWAQAPAPVRAVNQINRCARAMAKAPGEANSTPG